MASDAEYHVMRDHPTHITPIMGGMWGGKVKIPGMLELMSKWPTHTGYYDDQTFLAAEVWPIVRKSVMVHGGGGEPFPFYERDEVAFVGQRFDENNNPIDEARA
jgi:hypothetical protein